MRRTRAADAAATAEGMRHFLQRLRALLRRQGVAGEAFVQPLPFTDPHEFAAALRALRGPLQQARSSGQFINIWSVVGLRRNEVRNAAILAWFLDPRGSHGFGAGILDRFLREASNGQEDWPPLDLSRATVQTEERPLGSDTDRVDIAIDGADFVLFVEVKIDAPEGASQLSRYAEAAQSKAAALGKRHWRVVFLSPRAPKAPPSGVTTMTWHAVARALTGQAGQNFNAILARQFAHHVRAFC